MLYRIHLTMSGIHHNLTLVVIGTDFIGSCKFNCHSVTITNTTDLPQSIHS